MAERKRMRNYICCGRGECLSYVVSALDSNLITLHSAMLIIKLMIYMVIVDEFKLVIPHIVLMNYGIHSVNFSMKRLQGVFLSSSGPLVIQHPIISFYQLVTPRNGNGYPLSGTWPIIILDPFNFGSGFVSIEMDPKILVFGSTSK